MTTTRPMAGIQTAIFERLAADDELGAAVFDHVPEGAPYPYVVIGEAIETPNNWHGGHGRDTTVNLHVWSRQRGFSEANRIADRITQLLDHQPMTVPGHAVISVRHEFSQTLRDTDPEIRHVPIRFRITTEQE